MGTPESQKIGSIFGLKNRNTLFQFICVLSFLHITTGQPFALPEKDVSCALSSPKLIPAKAAIVVDLNKSVIYAKNQDVKLPPASTTKLVTAMVVLDHLNPDARARISPYASRVHSIPPRLRPYEELTVSDLLHLALMKSSNSAAAALAEEVAGSEERFAELMNQKAQSFGAFNTRFVNASGLPEGVQYITVYDLALVMNEALKYPLIKDILGKKECVIVTPEGRSLALRSTNKLLWADNSMIGGKTGYTVAAQHCFVGAFQTATGPIFTAVLGTSSRYRLWKSTELLSSLGSGTQSIPAIKEGYFTDPVKKIKAKRLKVSKASRLSKKGRKTQPLRLARR